MKRAREIIGRILEESGIQINGASPWDIQVHDERLYPRVAAGKNLGLGEAYMDGWWDCERIDQCISRLLRSQAENRILGNLKLRLKVLAAVFCNLQTMARSRVVAKKHYDLGNDLFSAFLDSHRQYSCAYFKDTDDLEQAQRNKLQLVCNKLELAPGDRLLDIGCGWGGLVAFAARTYGCSAVGVNISREQIAYARALCEGQDADIRACDYRELPRPGERFDKVVSVGMFEHVGPRNHEAFMETVARCLDQEGIFLLHTIGSNQSRENCDPWISKYIFPNGCLPSIAQIAKSSEGRFVMEDWHNLGPHYDRTLMCWLENFRKAWPGLRDKYGERFRRMWEYYLQSCAGAFRSRSIQLWQIVFTPEGRKQPCCRLH